MRKLQPDNPQRFSNVAETRMKPPGKGTSYTRWTKARTGLALYAMDAGS